MIFLLVNPSLPPTPTLFFFLFLICSSCLPGMKRDMGGAAAVLCAFVAAVKMGFKDNLCCLLAIAENSVGPDATRPDDIHTLYSGKTVEINNTDAGKRESQGERAERTKHRGGEYSLRPHK